MAVESLELYWWAVAFLAFLYIIVIIAKTLLLGTDTPGYASVMSAVLFFGGMQLLSIGILGEYIARLFVESKQRPLYLIAETSETCLRNTGRNDGVGK